MRLRLADSCPRCSVISYPHTLHYDRESILASYTCRVCRWYWTCWWNESCLEVGVSDRDSIAKVQSIPHRTGNRESAQAWPQTMGGDSKAQ